jgi:hypothetical protein
MFILSFSLACFLKQRCPAVTTYRAQSAVVPFLVNDHDSYTSATEPISALVAGAALSDAQSTASNDDGHAGHGPTSFLEPGMAAPFQPGTPAVESASPRGRAAGLSGSEEVAARGPTRRGDAAAQVCGPAEDAGGPMPYATLDQVSDLDNSFGRGEDGGSDTKQTDREAQLLRRIDELEKRLELVSA